MKGGLIKYFHDLRFDKKHHLGLGDIRLTLDQQKEICSEWTKMMKRIKELEEWYDDAYQAGLERSEIE